MTTTEGRLTPEREAFIREVYGWSNQSPISEVFRELDAVRRERDEWHSQLRGTMERLTTALRELDEARKDSARLDWWEQHGDVYKTRDDETSDAILSEVTGSWNDPQWQCLARARLLREAIDAAMAKDGGA